MPACELRLSNLLESSSIEAVALADEPSVRGVHSERSRKIIPEVWSEFGRSSAKEFKSVPSDERQ
jgi:hypothetical protein